MERMLYYVRCYLRTRLFKIELYCHHISAEGLQTNQTRENLSPAELRFCDQLCELRTRHFSDSFLDSLPEKHRAMNSEEILDAPPMNTFVFAVANETIGQ